MLNDALPCSVDLVVNSYERTFRTVLAPGFFPDIVAQNRRSFTRKIALINNVDNKQEAKDLADRLIARGEIDAYFFVEDYLSQALNITGLTYQDLGRVPNYSDCSLVAVTLPGSAYLLYWDAEVRLQKLANWVDPSLELMESDKRILVANPNWQKPTLERETLAKAGKFAIGYGFSDQMFLVRKNDLARPIYQCHCLASLRNPFAHVAAIFEQRVDAFMRTHRRLRATYMDATYEHLEKDGTAYAPSDWCERGRQIRNRTLVAVLKRLPTENPCFKV
jgi:hypothetical protein